MGSYEKWLIGLMVSIISTIMIKMATEQGELSTHISKSDTPQDNVMFKMATDDIKPDHVTTHAIMRRDTTMLEDDRLEKIIEKLKNKREGEASVIYNKMEEEDRISMLHAVVKKFYSRENVQTILYFANFIRMDRTAEKITVVQLMLEEMKSLKQLDQIEVLFIDCFLSNVMWQAGSSGDNISNEIIKKLKLTVDKVLTSLAEQIVQPQPATDLLLRYRGEREIVRHVCPEHFTQAVQLAYKEDDNVIHRISEFSVALSNSHSFKVSANRMMHKLYQLIEKSGHVIERNKPEMIEAVRQILIFRLGWLPDENDKAAVRDIGVKLGHNFDEDILDKTVSLIKQGTDLELARSIYSGISSMNYTELIARTFSKKQIAHLIDFAIYNRMPVLEPLLDLILDHMIDDGEGHNPAIFRIADKVDKKHATSSKIINLAIEMAFSRPDSDLLRLQNASEYYIGKIVEELYEPSEDTELKVITFAEKLNTIAGNAEGSTKAFLQLYTEMERHKHIELRPILAMGNYALDMRNHEKLSAERKDQIYDLWLNKIPWDIRYIVTYTPFCLVNNKYQSDHLLARRRNEINIVQSVKMDDPTIYNEEGLKWTLVQKHGGIQYKLSTISKGWSYSLRGTDDMMLCTSEKRKVDLSNYGNHFSWEIHDYDWKNNLYLLYFAEKNEYLYSDDQIRLAPPAGRHVYLAKEQNPVNPASVWRFSQC